MADHVAVGEVQNDNVILVFLDQGKNRLGNLICAHLRLEVEGGNLFGRRRRNENSVFAFELGFFAAVEEESYVGILLGFSNAQLSLSALGEVLAHRHGKRLRRICDVNIRHGRVILRHADVGQREEAVFALKALEVRIDEGAGDLTGAVGTEVEEDNGIVCLDHAVFIKYSGQNEFVGQVLTGLVNDFIGIADGLYGAFGLVADAEHHGVVRLFNAFPGIVTVHGIKTAHGGGNFANADFFHLFAKFFYIFPAGIRGHVAAVEKGVHINLGKAVLFRHFEDAVEVLSVGMNAAGRNKAD